MLSQIIILTLVVSIQTTNHVVSCNDIPTDSLNDNLSYLWGKATLREVDRYIFLVACPIIFILQVMILLILNSYSGLMGKTHNIFFCIVLFQLLINLHYFITSIYYTVQISADQMPSSFPDFCISNAIISGFLEIIHIQFVLLFPLYIIYMLRFTLKQNLSIWKIICILALAIAISLTWIFWYFELLGLNISGFCGFSFIRQPNISLAPLLSMLSIILLFIILGIYTIRYFKRHMPNTIGLRRNRQNQNKVLICYIIGVSIFLVFNFVINIIELISCKQNNSSQQQIQILVMFANIVRLTQFVFIFFIIFNNESFKKGFKKYWKNKFKSKNTKQEMSMELNKIGSLYKAPQSSIDYQQYLLDIKQQRDQLDLLKISQIITIVSGIYVAYKQYYNLNQNQFQFAPSDDSSSRTKSNSTRRTTKKIYYYQKMSVAIDSEIIKEYMVDLSLIPRLGILACGMTIHAPKVFQRMLQSDNLGSIFQSFELQDNAKKLFNLIEGQGGKSGQFFFFSYDNKYVLKTITQDQFDFIDQNLIYFHDHYQKNPNSLLAKIYGLFTFTGYEIQRTYHLILMKNILGCSKKQVIRTYDLKGSKYDRQVNKNNSANELQKITLKDIDFMKMEKRIFIKESLRDTVRSIIQNDTIFLKNLNLIDYSLLIVKVKWEYQPKDPNFWSTYQRIQSSSTNTEDNNTFYHIGIIDYLQKWDFQKKGEKWWKKLRGKKDISAQQPKKYQYRYMSFVDEILQSKREEQLVDLKGINLDSLPKSQQGQSPQKIHIEEQQHNSKQSKFQKQPTFGFQQQQLNCQGVKDIQLSKIEEVKKL